AGPLRLLVIGLDLLQHALALLLAGEGYHRRGAAAGRRAGAALPALGIPAAGRGRLLDVAVAVDAARHHVAAGRVDHPRGRTGQPLGERNDPAVLDADIRPHGLRRRHHGAAPNDHVELT